MEIINGDKQVKRKLMFDIEKRADSISKIYGVENQTGNKVFIKCQDYGDDESVLKIVIKYSHGQWQRGYLETLVGK